MENVGDPTKATRSLSLDSDWPRNSSRPSKMGSRKASFAVGLLTFRQKHRHHTRARNLPCRYMPPAAARIFASNCLTSAVV